MRDPKRLAEARIYLKVKRAFVDNPAKEIAQQFLLEAKKFHGKELEADKDFVDMVLSKEDLAI